MKELIIVGAGGFGRELLQWCKDINCITPKWVIKGFLDDNLDALNGIDCNINIVGNIKDWQPSANEEFALGIAEPNTKEKVVAILENKGANFISIIHPKADIGDFNKIGKGVVVYPNARITVNAHIGNFTSILDLTTIGHDSSVGDFSTICGGCGVNGHVNIEDHVFVGSHVTFVPGIKVGANAYIGAGSVVIRNVRDGYKVFGNPAKKVEF